MLILQLIFSKSDEIILSTPEYLNRFRSGFTLVPMMYTVKNDFDAGSKGFQMGSLDLCLK